MQDNIHPIYDQLIDRSERERFLNQRACVFWFTGLSGSGKSTVAKGVERALFDQGFFCQVLDGDNIRDGVCNNLTFSLEDRTENIRRIAEVAKLYCHSGVVVLCSFISPTTSIRSMAQDIIGYSDFHEIFVDSSIDTCESRDVKGLYQKARAGKIKGFTGIDSPYEIPKSPSLHLRTDQEKVEISIAKTVDYIRDVIRLK